MRTQENDYEEPKILQKTIDTYTSGLVKRIRLEVCALCAFPARKQTGVHLRLRLSSLTSWLSYHTTVGGAAACDEAAL